MLYLQGGSSMPAKVFNISTAKVMQFVLSHRNFKVSHFDRYVALLSFYHDCAKNRVDLKKNLLRDYMSKYGRPIKDTTSCSARQRLLLDIKDNGVKKPIKILTKAMFNKDSVQDLDGTNRLLISHALGLPTIPCSIKENLIDEAKKLGLIDG